MDLTLQDGAKGAEIVRSVLTKLEYSDFFSILSTSSQETQVKEQFMREMAYVTSKDGEETNTASTGGIWGVDQSIFEKTKSFNYTSLYQQIADSFCIDWKRVRYGDLAKPLYSSLAVKIYLYHQNVIGNRLPSVSLDRTKAMFWVEVFQQNQNYTRWTTYVAQLRTIEGK